MPDYQIDRNNWGNMHIFDQMGNIYSEVGRTFNAKKSNNPEAAAKAAARALDLFDATIEQLANQKSSRLQEVLRARAIFAGDYVYADTSSLEEYLKQFAVAARMRQTS